MVVSTIRSRAPRAASHSADNLLRAAAGIRFGRIEQGDAELQSPIQYRKGGGRVNLPAEGDTAEPNRADT